LGSPVSRHRKIAPLTRLTTTPKQPRTGPRKAATARAALPKPQAAALESAARRRRSASDSTPGRCVHGPLPAVDAADRRRPGSGGGSRPTEAHGDAGGADEGGGQGWRHLPLPLRGRAHHEIHHVSIPKHTLVFSLLFFDKVDKGSFILKVTKSDTSRGYIVLVHSFLTSIGVYPLAAGSRQCLAGLNAWI
jgi:hypothetical protein